MPKPLTIESISIVDKPVDPNCKTSDGRYLAIDLGSLPLAHTPRRLIFPKTFHFTDIDPCTYWSSGDHIVNEGACRCGMRFVLHEEAY